MTVLEIVISAAIIVTAVVGISGAWQLFLKISAINAQKTQAAMLVEEAGEALNIMRDQSWSSKIATLSLNTNYYLYWNNTDYTITPVATTTKSGLIRTIVFSAVQRDGQSDITSSGTIDPDTRFVRVNILSPSSESIVQAELLIHNVYNN